MLSVGAGLDRTPLTDALTRGNIESIVDEVTSHDWMYEADYDNMQFFIGDHPKLAEAIGGRKFQQLLWDVVGCAAATGDWREFTSQEQRLILYASFYGMEAPKRIPFQKGSSLDMPLYESNLHHRNMDGEFQFQKCWKDKGFHRHPLKQAKSLVDLQDHILEFPHFNKVMSCILPCEVEQAAVFFHTFTMGHQTHFCETHDEVIVSHALLV